MSDKILGIKINGITTKEVLEKIKGFLLSNCQHYIVTLNPEMVVESQKNRYLKNIINNADLVIPDGIGILLAYRYIFHRKLPEKITGIDLIHNICKQEYMGNYKIFLLGAEEGVARKAFEVLSNQYSNINIVGAEEGIKMNQESRINNQELIQQIDSVKPDILFVAFGAPKQEIWISDNIKKMPSVKLAIGVGGSFDFISGKIKRAPLIFQRMGLEWLYRLIKEPKRAKRIYNATVKFGLFILVNTNKFDSFK